MDREKKITVSVIIVNYNTAGLTVDCISSVLEKTNDIKVEIIVVDNASADGSVKIISEKFPGITVIENKTNIGFGKANNAGAQQANGDFLLLLNSDTILVNNAIKELANCMENDTMHNIGICGGNLFTAEMRANYSYFTRYPSLLNIIIYRSQAGRFIYKNDSFNTSGTVKDVAIIIGADIFIRRQLFMELGGFDPAFFMYVEDGELCLRVKKAGYRVVSVPQAKIIHYQGKSSTTGQKLIMEVTSYIYYFKKHHGKIAVKLYRLIELFFAVSKGILFIFIREKRVAYFTLIKFLLK